LQVEAPTRGFTVFEDQDSRFQPFWRS